MSVTINTGWMKYKNPNSGEYQGIDAITDASTADRVAAINSAGATQIAAVEAKGVETRASIPSDYTTLSDDVEALKAMTGLSVEAKQALLNCFANVVWNNADGRTYYDALEAALYPGAVYSITNVLTDCTSTNTATAIMDGDTYRATIIPSSGYTLDGATATATMGGQTVTGFYNNGQISIPNVTGNLVITVTAYSAVTSIAAVFTQGQNVIYDYSALDELKRYLAVTAVYADSTTAVVTDYTLSGDLSYNGETIIDLLDGITWTDGIAYDDDGVELDRPTLSCSDYIPVTAGTLYTYKKPYADTDQYGMLIYLYDSNKEWVGRETTAGVQVGSEYIKTYIPADGVAYVRLCSYVAVKGNAEFVYDATPASWTSTITVSYGGKTTTFSVTVSHKSNLVYHIENRVFDGTAGDGVATGVNIQAVNAAFTILAQLTTTSTMGGLSDKFTVFSSRDNPPCVQFNEYSVNAAHSNFRYMGQYSDNNFNMQNAGVYKIAVVHANGANNATCYMKANSGTVLTKKLTDNTFTTDSSAEVVFGARSSSTWYLKGTLNLGEIYNKEFSAAEIDAFMGS